jgi:hypothetical protein
MIETPMSAASFTRSAMGKAYRTSIAEGNGFQQFANLPQRAILVPPDLIATTGMGVRLPLPIRQTLRKQ